MKKIIYVLSLLALPIGLIGCSDDPQETPPPPVVEYNLELASQSDGVTISADKLSAEVVINPFGSEAQITVDSDTDWELVTDDDDQWCVATRSGNTITIKVEEYVSWFTRMTTVKVDAGQAGIAEINVSQDGTEKATLALDQEEAVFTENGGTLTVNLTTNREDWSVTGYENVDWLDVETGDNSFTVNASRNNIAEDLEAILTVRAGENDNYKIVEFPVTLGSWQCRLHLLPVLIPIMEVMQRVKPYYQIR